MKQVVMTSLYMGKLLHTEGRLASWGRDALLRWMVAHDIILKVGERELIDHCPVPVIPARARA